MRRLSVLVVALVSVGLPVAVAPPAAADPLAFDQSRLVASTDDTHSVVNADLDADGDVDVVATRTDDDEVNWYENNGAYPPVWTARPIAALESTDGAFALVVADLDGDDDLDVVSASAGDDKVTWYANDGSINNNDAWPSGVAGTSADAPQDMVAGDVDGDLDLDLVVASVNDFETTWFENDGAPFDSAAAWTAHVVDTGDGANGVAVDLADVDGDGDLDFITGGSGPGNDVGWYENPSLDFHTLTAAAGAFSVTGADMTGDGHTWTKTGTSTSSCRTRRATQPCRGSRTRAPEDSPPSRSASRFPLPP